LTGTCPPDTCSEDTEDILIYFRTQYEKKYPTTYKRAFNYLEANREKYGVMKTESEDNKEVMEDEMEEDVEEVTEEGIE